MDTGYLLSVEPQELQFPFELRKQISCSLLLLNKSDNYVAFKVKTTNPKNYCVRPNAAVVSPRSTCVVIVTMQAQTVAPPDMQCKDKFLLLNVVASPGTTAKDVNANMFNEEAGHHVEERELKVVYVAPPRSLSPVREGSQEGFSPRSSVSDDGSLSATVQTSVIQFDPKVVPVNEPDKWLIADRIGMDTRYLLSVEPQELQFPFELGKQTSCSLQLLNKSDNYVAFKVMTTNPKKYRVRPNAGVVSPRSTCDVIVTMQAQTEAPPDMQCKDKFLLRSVLASPGSTAKDVNAEMFNEEAGHHVEERKLKVVHVASPRPPSPVREWSEEGSSPRASVSDDGSLSASVQTSVIESGLKVDPLSTAFPSGMPSNIGPTQYRYEQLSKATGHFSNDYILGQGGFGQVFKGALHGEILAIKKLQYFEEQTREELVHEIAVISNVRHCNLVKLLGYCIEGANALLVLEYCLNKSLRFHLHGGKEILDWPTRRKIAIGSAKGLEYLHEHSSPKIIHRDIKPDNILLDINFEPKIADFGLALFFPDTVTHLSRSIAGTEVYIDPEHSGRVSSKSDIYSFGVVLLELITGRKPKYQGIDIISWAKPRITQALNGQYIDFVDSNLQSYDRSEMQWMISCAAACVYNPFESRPQMKEIVRALEGYSPPKDKAGTPFY